MSKTKSTFYDLKHFLEKINKWSSDVDEFLSNDARIYSNENNNVDKDEDNEAIGVDADKKILTYSKEKKNCFILF